MLGFRSDGFSFYWAEAVVIGQRVVVVTATRLSWLYPRRHRYRCASRGLYSVGN